MLVGWHAAFALVPIGFLGAFVYGATGGFGSALVNFPLAVKAGCSACSSAQAVHHL